MGILKNIAEKIPGYIQLRKIYNRRKLIGLSPENVFTEIFHKKKWGERETISGTGSTLEETTILLTELPLLFRHLDVKTILDIPCGDFNWMKEVDLHNFLYSGADIVQPIIYRNREFFENEKRKFLHLDLISNSLPAVDLILCRDCFVHFSFGDIFKSLQNIKQSGSCWFLSTTFPSIERNTDIITGEWRPLNLQAAPLNFPPPHKIISESANDGKGKWKDKSLGLWRIEDLVIQPH